MNETDSVTTNFKAKLVERGINEFFSTKNYCIGYIRTKKADTEYCKTQGAVYFNTYIFWTEKNEYWIAKLDNCGEVNNVQITDSRPMNLFLENIEELISHQVKPYQLKPDSIANGNKFSYIISRSHSCYKRFKFHSNDLLIKSHFDDFDLTSKEEDPNINFEYNNSLKVVQISRVVEELITQLEKKNLFIR